jgi:hypothetical protein
MVRAAAGGEDLIGMVDGTLPYPTLPYPLMHARHWHVLEIDPQSETLAKLSDFSSLREQAEAIALSIGRTGAAARM